MFVSNGSNSVVELPAGRGSPITLPFPTSGAGSLDFPQAVAVDSRGDVFAVNGTNTALELARDRSR